MPAWFCAPTQDAPQGIEPRGFQERWQDPDRVGDVTQLTLCLPEQR